MLSEGIGVTSSILPIFIPALAKALSADCAPGPGVLVLWRTGQDKGVKDSRGQGVGGQQRTRRWRTAEDKEVEDSRGQGGGGQQRTRRWSSGKQFSPTTCPEVMRAQYSQDFQ